MARTVLLFLAMLWLAGSAVAAGPPGKTVYEGTCIACHGPDGKGTLPGVPDFTATNGPMTQPESVIKKHILEGFQSPGSSSMAMPPKGGDPNLTEQDIDKVFHYIHDTFKH